MVNEPPELLRVFFDANVIFSASYREHHDFLQFWREPGIVCLTSFYAAEETARNCADDLHRARLHALLERTHFVSDATAFSLPSGIILPDKDKPILAAALQAGADYLITGDKAHFGQWMDQSIQTATGILRIMRPGPFLQLLLRRSRS